MTAREKILDAADRLFGECGFDGTALQRIADISQTNQALIHYHFKSKEGLFATVLDRYFSRLSDSLQAALMGEGLLEDRLDALVGRYMDFLEENRNFVHIIQREINGGAQMHRVIQHMTPIFRMVLRAIREAYPATGSGPLRAEQLLVSGYGMIVSYFTYANLMNHLLPSDPMSAANLTERRSHIRRMIEIIGAAVMADPAGETGGTPAPEVAARGGSHA